MKNLRILSLLPVVTEMVYLLESEKYLVGDLDILIFTPCGFDTVRTLKEKRWNRNIS